MTIDPDPASPFGDECHPTPHPENAPTGAGSGPTGWDVRRAPSRGDQRVRVVEESVQLVPVDRDVQVHPDPAAVPDVRRAEESLGGGLDERVLDTVRRGEPERAPVVVVAVRRRRELAATGREPGSLAVAQPLGDPGLGETAGPDASVRIVAGAQIARTRLLRASWVSSTSPSASSSGGRYIPKRPR